MATLSNLTPEQTAISLETNSQLQSLPPIYRKVPNVLRKKRAVHYSPNTFRVQGEMAEDITNPEYAYWRRHRGIAPIGETCKCYPPKQNDIDEPLSRVAYAMKEMVHNEPHPTECDFLRSNVATLNEPICRVHARSHTYPKIHNIRTQNIKPAGIKGETNLDSIGTAKYLYSGPQPNWWPIPSQDVDRWEKNNPSATRVSYPPISIMRSDFNYDSSIWPKGHTRFESSKREMALGIVPVNKLWERTEKPRYWTEGISFQHQYDSRKANNYQMKSKRHGAFVWNREPDTKTTEIQADVWPLPSVNDENLTEFPPARITKHADVTYQEFAKNLLHKMDIPKVKVKSETRKLSPTKEFVKNLEN